MIMKEIATQFIKKLNLFNAQETDAILAHTDVEIFKKGDIIAQEGKTSDKCYLVLKGCLRQYQIIDGEEKTTNFFLEGQPAVLYSSYLKKIPTDYFLSCVEDSVLLTGTRAQEQELRKNYPELEHLTYSLMLQDYSKAENYAALLNGYKPEDRYLILMEKQPQLLNRVPLHQIASFIGVTPESFSRIRKRIMANKA